MSSSEEAIREQLRRLGERLGEDDARSRADELIGPPGDPCAAPDPPPSDEEDAPRSPDKDD